MLKLFVWQPYYYGLAVVIAESEEEAREILIAKNGGEEFRKMVEAQTSDPPQVYDLDTKVAFYVEGQ
jgi:hypothetical protein